jgi:hypothetical protein
VLSEDENRILTRVGRETPVGRLMRRTGSVGVYMKDEARGFAVEFCVDHPQIDDETYQARILPAAPESRDIWPSPPPEPSAAALL